jgi:hypothetical protein
LTPVKFSAALRALKRHFLNRPCKAILKTMKTLTLETAEQQFDNLETLATREPVRITKEGKPVFMLLSPLHFEQFEQINNRLLDM